MFSTMASLVIETVSFTYQLFSRPYSAKEDTLLGNFKMCTISDLNWTKTDEQSQKNEN